MLRTRTFQGRGQSFWDSYFWGRMQPRLFPPIPIRGTDAFASAGQAGLAAARPAAAALRPRAPRRRRPARGPVPAGPPRPARAPRPAPGPARRPGSAQQPAPAPTRPCFARGWPLILVRWQGSRPMRCVSMREAESVAARLQIIPDGRWCGFSTTRLGPRVSARFRICLAQPHVEGSNIICPSPIFFCGLVFLNSVSCLAPKSPHGPKTEGFWRHI